MATKYHISDNGMPGRCDATSPDRCPKTQSGDSFHGTLEEAKAESQKRFEATLGAFATASKADEEREAAAAVKAAGEEVYRHPQGKIIKIGSDGVVRAYKNGKLLPTSATAEKLRAGYGAWKRDDSAAVQLPDDANSAVRPAGSSSAASAFPVLSEDELVDRYNAAIERAKEEARAISEDTKKFQAEKDAYDAAHADAEGRVFHYGSRGEQKGPNPRPGGAQFIRDSEEQKAAKEELRKRAEANKKAFDRAQTDLEEEGLGHRIPDAEEGNTIRVNTMAQKYLLRDELQGQISDGMWENSGGEVWRDWSNAKVIVDPRNPGRNFFTRKDNYQLNAKKLLDVVGDSMQENVREQTGNADYDEKAMMKDLADLRRVFKTKRDRVSGD